MSDTIRPDLADFSSQDPATLALLALAWLLGDRRACRTAAVADRNDRRRSAQRQRQARASWRSSSAISKGNEADLIAAADAAGTSPAGWSTPASSLNARLNPNGHCMNTDRQPRPRPLLITDCDEVLLYMVAPFREWLDEVHDIDFDMSGGDFAKALIDRKTREAVKPADIWPLLNAFFDTEMHRQMPIPGAIEALKAIGEHADIVVLTNLNDHRQQARSEQLARVRRPPPRRVQPGAEGRAAQADRRRTRAQRRDLRRRSAAASRIRRRARARSVAACTWSVKKRWPRTSPAPQWQATRTRGSTAGQRRWPGCSNGSPLGVPAPGIQAAA